MAKCHPVGTQPFDGSAAFISTFTSLRRHVPWQAEHAAPASDPPDLLRTITVIRPFNLWPGQKRVDFTAL